MLFARTLNRLVVVILIATAQLSFAQLTPTPAKNNDAVVTQDEVSVAEEETVPFDVRDKYRRSSPASSYRNYYAKALAGRFQEASNYLYLDGLPPHIRSQYTDAEWAKYLFVMLKFFFAHQPPLSGTADGELEDGLPPSIEWIADVMLEGEPVELTMRRIWTRERTQVWLFDSEMLLMLRALYEEYGYSELQWRYIDLFPEVRILGVELWLWVLLAFLACIGYGSGWLVTRVLLKLNRLKDPQYQQAIEKLLQGPALFLIAMYVMRAGMTEVTVTAAIRNMMEVGALTTLFWAWLISRCFTLVYIFQERRLVRQGNQVGAVLMRPALTLIRVLWYASAVVYVAKKSGYDVTTLLAGLGIGGMAVALASQDTLKNIFGSMMVLADKPFIVGQRIIANNYDGVVEEIGIRSTKLRLLNGHQVSIPNDIISRIEIENIGRRPYIRALNKVPLPYDTKPEKLEEAVQIARDLLEEHEGMDAEFPPKAYLNELTERGFSLMILYWYHPADYWQFQEFTQRFNLELARAFETAGIRFALPSTDIYLRGAHDDEEKLLKSES